MGTHTHTHTHTLSGTLGMVSEKHLGLSDLSCLSLPGGLLAALPSDTKETTKVLLEAGQRLRRGGWHCTRDAGNAQN